MRQRCRKTPTDWTLRRHRAVFTANAQPWKEIHSPHLKRLRRASVGQTVWRAPQFGLLHQEPNKYQQTGFYLAFRVGLVLLRYNNQVHTHLWVLAGLQIIAAKQRGPCFTVTGCVGVLGRTIGPSHTKRNPQIAISGFLWWRLWIKPAENKKRESCWNPALFNIYSWEKHGRFTKSDQRPEYWKHIMRATHGH